MAYKAPIWEDGKSPAISAENLNNLSQTAEGAQVLYGNSAPTSSAEGAVGQFYLVVVADSDGNYPLYQCVAIANGSYTWRDTRRIPDSITSMLGIPAPGTINRALNVLANVGNLHVWERVQDGVTDYLTSTNRNAYPDQSAEGGEPEKPAYYTLGNEQTNELIQTLGGSASLYFNVASSVSVADNGTVSLISPSQITLSASGSTMNLADYKTKCAGKFIVAKDQTYNSLKLFGIWYVGEDCEFTDVADSSAGTKTLSCSNMQLVTGHAKVEEIPANTTITYLGQLGGGARIEVGTYIGTGIESADILIGFTPKAVLIPNGSSFYSSSSNESAFILPGLPNQENVKRAEIIDGGFRVYYYSNSSVSRASYLNNTGATYRYIAIG